jgi:hypothetical protein
MTSCKAGRWGLARPPPSSRPRTRRSLRHGRRAGARSRRRCPRPILFSLCVRPTWRAPPPKLRGKRGAQTCPISTCASDFAAPTDQIASSRRSSKRRARRGSSAENACSRTTTRCPRLRMARCCHPPRQTRRSRRTHVTNGGSRRHLGADDDFGSGIVDRWLVVFVETKRDQGGMRTGTQMYRDDSRRRYRAGIGGKHQLPSPR